MNRLRGERGECGARESIKISSAAPHFGEESPQGNVGTGWRSKAGRKRDCSAGLLVRHLVLPEGIAGTEKVLRFVAEELSVNTYVNIMDQYRPCWKASEFDELNRRITRDEFYRATDPATELGLHREF